MPYDHRVHSQAWADHELPGQVSQNLDLIRMSAELPWAWAVVSRAGSHLVLVCCRYMPGVEATDCVAAPCSSVVERLSDIHKAWGSVLSTSPRSPLPGMPDQPSCVYGTASHAEEQRVKLPGDGVCFVGYLLGYQ